MARRFSRGVGAGVVLFALLSGWSAAWGLELDQAKLQGLVGEGPDGYLHAVVERPSPDVASLVEEINRKRREKYLEIAERNGTSLQVVERLAGKKAIEKTPSGQYVKVPAGTWIRK